jgi:hypothetical protein
MRFEVRRDTLNIIHAIKGTEAYPLFHGLLGVDFCGKLAREAVFGAPCPFDLIVAVETP